MSKNLNYYISRYFKNYLPKVRGASLNTIRSYRDTFVILFEYVKKYKKEVNLEDMPLDCLNFQDIEQFLDFLENTKNNSISTRNQRLCVLKGFYKFLKKYELSQFQLCSNISNIPLKKGESKMMLYFSVEEIKLLFNAIDINSNYGLRDYTILLFMYETACRGQELADLRIRQLNLNEKYVVLIGKGKKSRRVSISTELVKTLKRYFVKFEINSLESSKFVFTNFRNEQLTTKGIEYILQKYVNICKKLYLDKFKYTYSNHSMRHSRAMHLLESGINLIYIRDLLGHSSVTTTEIYAKCNPKIKEQEIKKHSQLLKTDQKYSKDEKNELLEFLKNL